MYTNISNNILITLAIEVFCTINNLERKSCCILFLICLISMKKATEIYDKKHIGNSCSCLKRTKRKSNIYRQCLF